MGLKTIGFQCIQGKEERKSFVKNTKHNPVKILTAIMEKCSWLRPEEELKWMQKYFADLSQKDRESDSFRYPFYIVWESDDLGIDGKFVIKKFLVNRPILI